MQEINVILKALSSHLPVLLPETPHAAAVMVILLCDDQDKVEIVLTKRAMTLPTYAGDYSFPGGMHEINDATLYQTAARELKEELSIPASVYQYIGQLDDFIDRFGNLVRPFVILMRKNDFLSMQKQATDEIAGIYYFSLIKATAIQDNPELYGITKRRPSYAYTDNDVFVWGLTASILVHLWNIISGEERALGKEINQES